MAFVMFHNSLGAKQRCVCFELLYMWLRFPSVPIQKSTRVNLFQRFLDTNFNKTPLIHLQYFWYAIKKEDLYSVCLFLFQKSLCENTLHKTPQIPTNSILQLAAESTRKKCKTHGI